MAKVFVSYSRKDKEFAKRLTTELKKSDLDFWIDWEGIPPTVDWWREIEKGIEESDIFIFLISPDSSKSKVCKKEIAYAMQNSKRIIPLVVRDLPKEVKSPKQLDHLNWIFFRKTDNFKTSLHKLLTAIHTDYEWAAAHRRLQVKALEWERNHREHGFLLRGKDLLDAESNLAENTSKEPYPTDLQRQYINESRKATDRQKRITTGVSIAGVIALAILAIFGFIQATLAKAEARHATVGKLALESKTSLDSFPQRALLLALEAVRLNQNADEPVSPEAEESLRFAVERVSGINPGGLDHAVWFTRFVQDENTGTWLIAGSTDQDTQVHIWNMDRLMNDPAYAPFNIQVPIPPDSNTIAPSIDKSPQGTWLITNAIDGYSVWQIADADETRTAIHFEEQPVFIDPNDDSLVLEQQSEQVVLWRLDVQSLDKVEIGRFDGEYRDVGPQDDSIIISTDKGDQIVKLPENGNDLRTIEFEGAVEFANPRSERWVFEKRARQSFLWDVDLTSLQKQEVHRFAGQYDHLVVDPQEKWLIAFEAVTHPDIMVTFTDEMGETVPPEPWVSSTIHTFALDNLREPLSSLILEEHGSPGKISPDGRRMLFDAAIVPDEYGSSQFRLGMINFNESPPTIHISSTSSYDISPEFVNEHWLLNDDSFYDLRDSDLEADAVSDSRLFFGSYLYASDENSLEFAEDGKYLVVGRERVNLEALDGTGELVIEPNPDADPSQTDVAKLLRFDPFRLGVEGEVSAAAISPDGHWVVAGTIDGSVRLWDNERPWASSIQMEPSSPYMIALSNDNKWLATGDTFWRLENGIPTSTYKIQLPDGHEQAFNKINGGVFSPDSRWFIHLSVESISDNNIQVNVSLIDMTHDLSQPTITPDLIGEPGKIYDVIQFSRDSKWVVFGGGTIGISASEIGSILFDLENKISYRLPVYTEAVFSTAQDHLILIPPGFYDEAIEMMVYSNPEIWSLPKGPGNSPEKIGTFDTKGQHVIISNNGHWLATAADTTGWLNSATPGQIWDVNCMIEGYSCKPFTITTHAASFSPDSRYLMLAWTTDIDGLETNYEVWDMQPWERNANAEPRKVAFRNSAVFIPVIGKTGGLAVLRKDESCDTGGRPLSTALLSSTWSKHPWLENLSTFDGYAYMALSSGGGGAGGEAGYHVDYRAETLTWDGGEYQSIALRGHESSISAVQVSPDERFVLTFSGGTGTYCGDRENLLRLWDMSKLIEDPLAKPVILPLKDDSEYAVSHLAFSPDSNWIYVIDSHDVLYYFPTSVEALATKACNAAGRNFIINEWERFFPGETYRKTCENLPVHPSVISENTSVPSENS